MGATQDLLDEVRKQLAPDDAALSLARRRRDAVRAAAATFRGVLRHYPAGSLAHGTANCPIHHRDLGLDGDCGVVLDRRSWASLGPDGQGVGPVDVVNAMRDHLAAALRSNYPGATLQVTKRAILIEFHDALPTLEDPSVDIVVGLTRANAPGLWIPNTETNTWNPSDPEQHTALLTGEPKAQRVTRARAIRLAKAHNKLAVPPPLCSFNVEAFGLMFVKPGSGLPQALLDLWSGGAVDLSRRLTPDPAGVSQPIKVADRAEAVRVLSEAAKALQLALGNDANPAFVRSVLQPLWPDFISPRPGEVSKAMAVARTRSGEGLRITGAGLLSATAGSTLKQPRSFGE